MRRIIFFSNIVYLILVCTSQVLIGQDVYPENPSAWINDYADILSPGQEEMLNRKLSDYQDSTGTQIFIVTTNRHQGAPISYLAAEIGEKWGVGSSKDNNGVLLLIYPDDREIFIATGYGVEQYLTDAVCKRIIENEIKPSFVVQDYYHGLDRATDVMTGLLSGLFTAEKYAGEEEWTSAIGFIVIFILFMVLFTNYQKRKSYSIGKDLPFWVAMSMLSGSLHNHSGNFGNFRSGGGGFGGFGGFSGGGGGSFGGGGAGGRW